VMSMIHSVGGVGVKVGAVSGKGGFHFTAAFIRGIIVGVVDAEEEWVEGWVGSRCGELGGSKDCGAHG